MAVKFIPYELVIKIHDDLMKRYGGLPGLRDLNLLKSAFAQPQMSANRKYVNKSIFDKAAAYGFHICRNHPFIDGNKRVAFVLMDIFLQQNGWEIIASEEDAYSIMIDLASGKVTKPQLSNWLKMNCGKLSN